jgi:hypothetical protein
LIQTGWLSEQLLFSLDHSGGGPLYLTENL